MSVCGSTYCLSERRSMELCFVELELDLTARLDFSGFCVRVSFLCLLHSIHETTLGSVFWISNCPKDRFKILWHQRQWSLFVFGWPWPLSNSMTWTMARRYSLTNIPNGCGLRKDPIAAVERAQYFNDWTPEGPKGEFCAKDYVLVEVELTAIGYLQKAEAGIPSEV